MAKVILIDDDYATEILVENLRFRGYDARRINSMSAAMKSIDEVIAADLVILDIIMERSADLPSASTSNISGDRTTGMELLRTLREKKPELPILVFSATTDPELIDAIGHSPHTDFLSKWGSNIREFVEKVEKSVGGASEERQPRAFIVHGHDTVEKLNLKNYLQNTLGFAEPIILHEQPSLGRTIIEKLED